MNQNGSAKAALIFSTLVFGTIGIFVRLIPLPSAVIAMFRAFIGVLFLFGFLALRRIPLTKSSIVSHLLPLIISGCMIGFNWILLFEAYNYTSVAVATLCYYLAPVFVILVSPLVLHEKLTVRKLLCVLVALVGMVFVSGVIENGGMPPLSEFKGVLLGLGAAALYACVMLINKRYLSDVPTYDKTILQLGSAGVILIPYTLIAGSFVGVTLTTGGLLMLLVVGILHTGIAYAAYFGAMGKLRAQTVALFSYIDPVTAILLSALLLHETMTVYGIIGAVLILGSTLFGELTDR